MAPEGPGMPSATEYPDSWQTILKYHEEAMVLMGAPQTVAMQAQEFHKFGNKVSAMMDIAAARFGFEGALVTCGKVVNQDGSLGLAHTMAGAAGFWLMRCKADDDTIIGHLKAQVYNLMSLGVVEEAFQDEIEIVQHNQSKAPIIEETTKECLDISKNGIPWIKQELAQQIEKLGGKLSSKRNFPWKTLPAELICLGMIIKGYPEDVLLPGDFHTTSNKGIANLMLKEIGILVAALKAGSMQVKKASEAMQAKLLTSEMPILEGAPPAEDCAHRGGCHLFANGQSDCLGLPHAKPSAAATRMKKAPIKSHTSLATLSDDNNSDDDSSVQPILKPPLSCKFKVVRPPKSQKKVKKDEKKIIKKNIKKEVISLVSSEVSDACSGSEKPEDDDNTKSNSDYEDDSAASKKRKAKSETTLRASKKRVSPAEPPLPKAGYLKSLKGKDDEEAPNVTARVIERPSKCLHDGPKVQEVPKASAETNDANGTARGSVEAPTSTKPANVAAHANGEPNDADGTARGSVEAPASTKPAAAVGHADSVPACPLPPLSPLQIRHQVPSLPEHSIQTNAATLVMRLVNDAVQIEPATHVVASNTLCRDPVHADPTTHAASLGTPSQTIIMILVLCTVLHNFLLALSPILISINPLMAHPINPLMSLNLSITTAGIMMLHTMTPEMDMMDMLRVIAPSKPCLFWFRREIYGREYPNEYPEDHRGWMTSSLDSQTSIYPSRI
ncbi:hypothetical protein F4604DRAFT_1681218 [Suillus subluteus]|nr:hypothetical protein F4604DRAFT_1681218 [Suillus subluteus]